MEDGAFLSQTICQSEEMDFDAPGLMEVSSAFSSSIQTKGSLSSSSSAYQNNRQFDGFVLDKSYPIMALNKSFQDNLRSRYRDHSSLATPIYDTGIGVVSNSQDVLKFQLSLVSKKTLHDTRWMGNINPMPHRAFLKAFIHGLLRNIALYILLTLYILHIALYNRLALYILHDHSTLLMHSFFTRWASCVNMYNAKLYYTYCLNRLTHTNTLIFFLLYY